MSTIMIATMVFLVISLSLTFGVLVCRHFLVPSRPLTVSVIGTDAVTGRYGQKLLGVLEAGGIELPTACAGAGTCGLCRLRVLDGGGRTLKTEKALFSPQEVREKFRLACQLTLRGNVEIELPETFKASQTFAATVVSTRFLSPLIREIRLALPAGANLPFQAGDFIQLTAPAGEYALADVQVAPEHLAAWQALGVDHLRVASALDETRAYSLANSESESGELMLLIRLATPPAGARASAPPGFVSSWLFTRRVGDSISVKGAFGDFHIEPGDAECVFIGGGVGMAPLRSMILTELANGSSRRMSFWYGTRSVQDRIYVEAFDRLQQQHSGFGWHTALSDPEPGDDWHGAVGFVHEILRDDFLAKHDNPEACLYYLCGPPLMVAAVTDLLAAYSVPVEQIHFDNFG